MSKKHYTAREVAENASAFEQRIAELEAENKRLREALHEIYGKACQAIGDDDDLYLYSFAQDARAIALGAGGG